MVELFELTWLGMMPCVVFFLFLFMVVSRKIITKQEIIETTELVIEAAIDHGYVEASRSEGDYDLNVSREGTEKIRKILEAL